MNKSNYINVSLNMPSCMMQFWNQAAGQIVKNVTAKIHRNNLKHVSAFRQQMDQLDTKNEIDNNFIS